MYQDATEEDQRINDGLIENEDTMNVDEQEDESEDESEEKLSASEEKTITKAVFNLVKLSV